VRSIHIPALELSISGIDEATIAAALEALPQMLAAEIRRPRPNARPALGALNYARVPSADALAAGIAERVAHDVRSQAGAGREGA
jgi:hypothetical protein